MSYLLEPDRESGPAADTGSAAHYAVSRWHKGSDLDTALREMRDSVGTFPQADLDQAEKYFRSYAKDTRNAKETVVEAEWLMKFELPPHPLDPTKKPIYLEGTCDQIRTCPRGYEIWDYKTGADEGWMMLMDFAPQLAAYTYGASKKFPPGSMHVGGIIRARGYWDGRKKAPKEEPEPSGVFWASGMSQQDVDAILYRIRFEVAGIRRRYALFGPGSICSHCPHGGLGACVPLSRHLGLQVVEN